MIKETIKKLNLTRKKQLGIILGCLTLIVGGVFAYRHSIESYMALGFNEVQAYNDINAANMLVKPSDTSKTLNNEISKMSNELAVWGHKLETYSFIQDSKYTLVQRHEMLTKFYNEKSNELSNMILALKEKAKLYSIEIKETKYEKIIDEYVYYKKLVDDKEAILSKTVDANNATLSNNGFTTTQLKSLNNDNLLKTIENQEAQLKLVKSWESSISSADVKKQIMNMFNQTNEYRKSKGLTPYTYNYAKQSCVDKEAKAYAANGNPHNWLCKSAVNENAGIAGVNSNYVNIAMNFFKSDPPHEAVLSGNYKSVAISIVQSKGKMHMIMDVFN